MPLQIRRGLQAQRTAMTVPLAEGELLYVTDDQQLYIGNGTTSPVLVSAYSNEQAQDATAALLLGPNPTSSPDNTRHSGITFVYDDASDRLDAVVELGELLEADSFKGNVLANDDTVLVNASNKQFSGTLLGTVEGTLFGNVQGNLVGDTKGSVFADDSTLLVDATNANIPYSVLSGAPAIPTIGNYVFNGDTVTVTGVDDAPILENNAIGATASSGGVEINFNSDTVSHSMWLNGQDGLYLEINQHLLNTGGQLDWNFNTTGGLTFPDATVQTTAYTGYHTGDVTGSVFADDSTLLVDGVNGSFSYIPTNLGDWVGTAPTTVGEAIDRLATLIKALNAGTGA